MFISTPIAEFIELINENIKPHIKVAEIGVFDGSTSNSALSIVGHNNGEYICIDWFKGTQHPGWEASKGHHSYKPDKDVYEVFINNMKPNPFYKNLKVIRKKSLDAVLEIPDEYLDICFIDADHSYKAVLKDIEAWFPKVKAGGIICGHDFDDHNFMRFGKTFTEEQLNMDMFNGAHVGVVMAVYEKFGKPETKRFPHSTGIWIYRKPIMLKEEILNIKQDQAKMSLECDKNEISNMLKEAAQKKWGGIEFYFTNIPNKDPIVDWIKESKFSFELHESSIRIFI